ncbi:MAG: hypothetical protein WCP45_02330 [Verrucomicrobiota bacterium]
MAIQIRSIVKALTPLIAASSGLAGLLGERTGQNRNLAADERLKRLEDDLLRMGEVFGAAVARLQAAAQELQTQAELYESQRARLRWACILSALALGVSGVAVGLAIFL